MYPDRRSVLGALGIGFPFLAHSMGVSASSLGPASLRMIRFEDAVREALLSNAVKQVHRVAVGWCELVQSGLQGCVNMYSFAGQPAGCLRIVRTGSEPGPVINGARLCQAFVDLIRSDPNLPGRKIDYAGLQPAYVLDRSGQSTDLELVRQPSDRIADSESQKYRKFGM
jgi:hypothetical protein